MPACWFICILLAIKSGCTDGQTINDTATLMGELFSGRNYSKLVRPTTNQSRAIEVSLAFTMTNINAMDITNNLLLVSGFLTYTWYDELLSWKPAMYGGVTCLPVTNEAIWRPQLIQYTLEDGIVSTKSSFSSLRVSSDGRVDALSAREFATSCAVDVFVYPFDQHRCDYTFLTPIYHKDEARIQSASSTVDTNLFQPNGEWNLVDTRCVDVTQDTPLSLGLMLCALNIRRRPAFVILHATVPLMLLTGLTCMVFWVAPDCGERITVSVTLSLAYTVILTRQSNEIPRNSIHISLYSQFLVLLNAVSAACVAYSIIVVRVSMPSVTRVPAIMVQFTKTVMRMKRVRSSGVALPDEQVERQDVNGGEKKRTDRTKAIPDIVWLDVAAALDKVMFALIIVALLASITAGTCYIYIYKDALSTLPS